MVGNLVAERFPGEIPDTTSAPDDRLDTRSADPGSWLITLLRCAIGPGRRPGACRDGSGNQVGSASCRGEPVPAHAGPRVACLLSLTLAVPAEWAGQRARGEAKSSGRQ